MTAAELSDWGLVAAAQAGDAEAFGRLWARHQHVVRAVAAKRLGQAGADGVDDVVSATALKAWRAVGALRPERDTARGWLTTIAYNAATDWHKTARTRSIVAIPREPITTTGDGAWSADRAPGAEVVALERAATAAVARRLGQYLGGLSDADRELVRLRFGAELSLSGCAALMGCTVPAVKSRQHRLIQRLAAVLAEDGLTSSADCVTAWRDTERRAS